MVFQKMFQSPRHAVTPRLMAYVTILFSYHLLHHWDGVMRRDETGSKLG